LVENQRLERGATARRKTLRDALVAAAERTIEQEGLRGLKARPLAEAVGCAVGAIYNAVEDLDELALLVAARTLAALERELLAAADAGETSGGPEAAVARLVRMALAYLDFAAANTQRWRYSTTGCRRARTCRTGTARSSSACSTTSRIC
jgi:AcrR family transcriptional regulator